MRILGQFGIAVPSLSPTPKGEGKRTRSFPHRDIRTIPFLILVSVAQALFAQSWQDLPDIPEELAFPVVVELRGNIHVIGGGAPGGATDLHLRYSPATNTWDTMPPVPYLAQQPAGAVVDDKIHYCGGGYPNTGTRLDDHYIFDPDSNMWFQAADMPVPTAIHEAVGYDGKLYVFSGQPDKTLCEYYDPGDSLWHPLNPLPDQHFWYGAMVSTNDAIYRFGGGGFLSPQDFAHWYDAQNDNWIPLADLPRALHAPAASVLNDSLIVLSGGYNVFEIDEVWIYNTNTDTYAPSESLPVARNYHSMATVDSCAYSVGGYNSVITGVEVSLIRNCDVQVIAAIEDSKQHPRPYNVTMSPGHFALSFNEPCTIRVLDMQGRLIHSESGARTFILNSRLISAGSYVVIISSAEGVWVEKCALN